MEQLKKSVRERWSVLGLAARLWWAGLATVGVAAVLVLAATTVADASSHPAPNASAATKTAGSGAGTSSGSGSAAARDQWRAWRWEVPAPTPERVVVVSVVGSRHADDFDRVLQRQGRDHHVQRHGDGAGSLGVADRGPAGGGQPVGGGDRSDAGQVHQPLNGHGGRLHAGHQPERVPGPLRQLAGRQDAMASTRRTRPSSCTPTRSTGPSSWAPCTSGRRPAHPGRTSVGR